MMPGSTAVSTESSKAKVTSETNGVFVRPVAVAGIFRPANEGASKPPALPEKRRFSALVGDLRPASSGDSSSIDDFARRRQSWDNRQKEVPFGQALLRKTPKNANAPASRTVKSDDAKNASPGPENSSRVSDSDNLFQISQTSTNTSTEKSSYVKTEKDCDGHKSDSTRKQSELSVNNCSDKELKLSRVPESSEKLSGLRIANEKQFSKITETEINKKACAENAFDTAHSSTENIKQTKKIYGLAKREAKSEIPTVKNDNVTEISADTSASLKTVSTKSKVYGLSKTIVKKDLDIEKVENVPQSVNKLKTSGVSYAESRNDFEKTLKKVENVPQSVNKLKTSGVSSAESGNDLEKTLKKVENVPQSVNKLKTNEVSSAESGNVIEKTLKPQAAAEPIKAVNENKCSKSPPKDFRTVRRTSDVIAARIQNMFSNFQPEKIAPVFPKKSKVPEKISSPVTCASVHADENKKEEKINVLSSGISISSESKAPSISGVKNDCLKDESNTSKAENTKLKTNSIGNSHHSVGLTNGTESSVKYSDTPKSNQASVNLNVRGVKAEPSLKKDCIHESSINTASSKQLNKKVDNIEGRMPIKKEDQSSSDGTKSFLIATNQKTDRKSTDSTATSNLVMQGLNKISGAKIPASATNIQTFDLVGENSSQRIISSKGVTDSSKTAQNIDLKTSQKLDLVEKSFQSSFSKSSTTTKTNSATHSVTTTHAVQLTNNTSYLSSVSSDSLNTEVQKRRDTANTVVNGSVETSEISKLEITKLTPSTVPGIVPTVNVLFRTKSPQGSSNKDENRKKVVIETSSNSAPISSAVIISPKPLNTPSLSSVVQPVNDTQKAVENVQLSLNSSPKVPKKHTIVNLQKQALATVDLSSNKCASPDIGNIETKTSHSVDQSRSLNNEISINTDTNLGTLQDCAVPITQCKTEAKHAERTVSTNATKSDNANENKTYCADDGANVLDKVAVVNLDDWSKKFQRIEPEAPRVPLRRRAFKDSLPPSLPLRSTSRYGSLKRIEDSTRYLPRSPSHSSLPRSPSNSSLPQRYSYTEMLSKVCSMGVLPYVEPAISKSCSSSSSQVSELWSELSEEQSTATHASEMLESETTERMRLEKEVHELQNRYSQVQQRSDKMEMEIMESRVFRTSELNGDLSEDEDPDPNGSIYKQKYERAVRDMEMMKRRIQQAHEEEMEQKTLLKKASDKRLAEALEDVDEERQIANQWKRKAQKCGAELQDLRLMLEEQMARNGELEKKQRRFDAELSSAQEEMKKEKLLREKLMREKDQVVNEKYSLEQELQSVKLDSDMLHEKITQLNRELDELSLSSKGEEEVTQLKRAKQELERKSRDQEEELEELAAQVQMLEQAKLRLEMSLEKVRQEHRRETSVREEEVEEIRASFSKKIKNLEAQLESEQDERHQLVKQKHELERRIYEIADQPPPHDPEIERRLRRDLKRTKALLKDAQSMLEHTRDGQSSKTLIRQLKNQLEDSEFAKATAIKARQAVETELQDCQLQLEEITRTKNEAETRCLQLSREKSAIQTQLEEAEEEMAEVMKKYKAVVAQMSVDQKQLGEQNQQIAELETERQMLKEQLNEVSHKFEHLAGQSDDAHKVHWLDSKIRDLESKLELEQTTKARLEHQISRLKEQNDRAREECDSLRNKELQAQEAVRRLQRQIRDSREDYSALQQKEADGYRKQHELEMALENTETDLQVTKNDLRLACQRIQDLQNALEDDLDSGTDVPDDSGSDSDSSFEMSVLRNSSLTPTQRCESVASNLSYSTEGHRSRTASFTQELSAFSSRDDAEKDINGFSGLNSTSGLLDTEDKKV